MDNTVNNSGRSAESTRQSGSITPSAQTAEDETLATPTTLEGTKSTNYIDRHERKRPRIQQLKITGIPRSSLHTYETARLEKGTRQKNQTTKPVRTVNDDTILTAGTKPSAISTSTSSLISNAAMTSTTEGAATALKNTTEPQILTAEVPDVTMEDACITELSPTADLKKKEAIEVPSDDDDVEMVQPIVTQTLSFASVKVKKEYLTKEEMQEDAATVLDSEEDTVVSMKRKAEEDPDEQRKSVQPVTEDDKSNSADTNNSQYQSCSGSMEDILRRRQEAQARKREKEDKEDDKNMAAFMHTYETVVITRKNRAHENIDRSETSYSGEWKTVASKTGDKKGELLKEATFDADLLVPTQVRVREKATVPNDLESKGPDLQKTRFEKEAIEKGDGEKRSERNKTKTRRTFTSAEEALAHRKEPEDISAKYETVEKVRHVYFLSFDLYTEKQGSYAEVIQILFDKILDHDKDATIKAYSRKSPLPDIGWGSKLKELCYTRSQFREYFYEVWDTTTRGPKSEPYRVHGKMRLESALDYNVLKGRMLTWLTDKRHFLHKPFVQTEKVIKVGLLLGSSTAQHRLEVQRQLEEAIRGETGKYIQLEVQKKIERFKNNRGGTESTPILIIEAGLDHREEVEESLKKILKSGKPSPIGRRVSFIPSPNKTTRSTVAYNRLMQRQKEMNHSERALATKQILDARRKVHIKDGTELTVQQIICGMTDHDNNKIFTGAEVMGRSDKTLLTFNVNMEVIARMTATRIAEAVKRLINEEDYGAVEDERKIASRETRERQYEEEQSYISGISSEWVYNSQREEGESVSTMSSLTGLESVSNTLNFSTEAKKTESLRKESTSDTTVNQWESTPKIRKEDSAKNTGPPPSDKHGEKTQIRAFADMQRRLQEISNKADKEQEERRRESAAYASTFESISTTIEKQQKQISTQNEDLKQMRNSQLEIRQAQAAQLVILQQILLALHGEGSLTDTAAAVDTLITRTRDQQPEVVPRERQMITQSQSWLTMEARDGDSTKPQPNDGKAQDENAKPPSGGER